MKPGLKLLKQNPLWKDTPPAVLEKLVSLGKPAAFPAGEVLFVEMSTGDDMFLILEGSVTVELALANADLKYEIVTLGPGEILGEVSFLHDGHRSATVIAKDDVKVLAWKGTELRRLSLADPLFGYNLVAGLARILCERLRRWNVRILDEVAWGVE